MTRILIVEDDPALAIGLRNDLALEGYEVDVVADGQSAVERAMGASFDLVLLDLMLPRKDGFAVCRELRRAGVRTPIIVLSARTQDAEKVLGFELGADDYVTKPFSPLELRARIAAMLRRTRERDPSVCRVGTVDVDFDRGLARRDGAAIDLTPLELKVLRALVRADGRLLTRSQIVDAAWGPGVAISDRVVDNHVMNLRRKLEPEPAAPRYLLSARGLGYRFEKPDDDGIGT